MDQFARMTKPAVAPAWMLEKQNSPSGSAASKKLNPTLVHLSEQCPVFDEDFANQQEDGLWEERWHQWTSLLVKSGHPEAALEFSKASKKHDERSEERIAALQSEENRGTTRCTTFGCNKQQISKCHRRSIRRNENDEITNSPGKFVAISQHPSHQNKSIPNLTAVGFSFDPNTGQPKKLNANIFSKHVVEARLDLIYVHSDRFYLYKDGIWKLLTENALRRIVRNILHEYVPNFWTSGVEEQYMQALTLDTPSVEQIDTKRQFINLENGMLDLDSFKLVPHDKSFYSTVRIPLAYDAEAECPQFMRFLNQIFENDSERIQLVQEMFGYCLTSDVIAQKAFILFGKGANGKSVLADILETIIGPANTCALTLSDLENSFSRSELVDKQLILSTENETDSKGINTQFLKSITSGDAIRAEPKHKQGFMYRPFCKVVLGMNNLPNSRDKSHAFMRRLIIIPFNRTFDTNEADVHLTKKLKKELCGIFNFALEGLRTLQKKDFKFIQPEASNQILKTYEEEINPLTLFVEETIEKGTMEDRVSNKNLERAYKNWCDENSISHPLSNQRLARAVRETLKGKKIPTEPIKSGGLRYSCGIKLKPNLSKGRYNRTLEEVDDIDSMS
ncbi:phage/plasmid primase, P4 family [Saccharibacillus sp. CPCC 101409]|uniref:DNA primase family protein n=1 Tax=Saccharibacillus sp. CPCC 101409 TaxID=3058041 RepID=UPI002670E658|nr:phage/plasmid primase, P4 family [Saccharibacillus sp. CPCC 101409]MDO3409704.1 phage/plasmid primase, P4 family [Saccharibacillus sp. CPCC 101409]